ncbi:hypothetical protein [Streptomyces sp. NPDC054842]
MSALLVTLTVLVSFVCSAVAVLLRRDRRRSRTDADARAVGPAATGQLREVRRRVQAYHHFDGASGIAAARDRDGRSSSWYG